jgi:FkbM family methyltransferase
VNLALALLVGCLLLGFGFQHSRKIRFLVTRDVRVDGLTLSLDPQDKMVTLHILDHGNYEPAETRVVRDLLKPGDTFIDVGANIGWYTLIGSRIVGEQGRVIAFEPAPASFGLLSRNARINGCRNTILVDDALSNKAGKIRLNLGDTNKGHNSFLKTSETKESVEVDAVTLDAYLKGDKREIALIKIDVEGAEGFVLEGMKETLRNQPRMALLMEFFPTLIRQAGFDPAAMLREFLGSGYEIHDIEETPGQLTPIHEAGIPALVERLENGGAHINVLIKRPS